MSLTKFLKNLALIVGWFHFACLAWRHQSNKLSQTNTYLWDKIFLSGTDRTNVCCVKEGCSSLKPAACSSLPLEVVDSVEFDAAKLNVHLNKDVTHMKRSHFRISWTTPSLLEPGRASASRSLGSIFTWVSAIIISPTDVTWDRSLLPRLSWSPDWTFIIFFYRHACACSWPVITVIDWLADTFSALAFTHRFAIFCDVEDVTLEIGNKK